MAKCKSPTRSPLRGRVVREGARARAMDAEVDRGTVYLLRTSEAAKLLEFFNRLRRGGAFADKGLVVSRSHPDRLKERHQTGDGDYVWLTSNSVDGVVCAAPTAISLVHMKIVDFFKRHPNGVVALDGAEYLITNNTFETFLRFVHSVHDRVMVTQGVLLIAVDPHAVGEREMHLLAKECQELASI